MKIISRLHFTFSLARAAAARAVMAPRVVAATTAVVGGGVGPTRTSTEKSCSATPPWPSATLIRTAWAPASAAVGDHSTSPVVPSIVIPAGASRRENVWTSCAGYASATVTWYRSYSTARTCAGGGHVNDE